MAETAQAAGPTRGDLDQLVAEADVGGRIVEAFARGKVAPQSVIGFYDQTLPQLGWQPQGRGSYQREGERLELDLGEDAQGTTVHFRLFPQ